MDRISNLPSDVICHIGSFLSAKEAAFASILSKRWRNLFTIIPKLHFDDSVNDGESFKNFVDGVLALPASSRVRKLSLKCSNHVALYDEQINRCLCDVVKRGVLVLKLEIKVVKGGSYSLPFEVLFTCKTVAKMKLGSGFAIDLLPEDAFLPALKTLFLDSVRFCDSGGYCAFQTLLSASPVLEELVIDGVNWELWKWSCNVSSPTLQRLTIRREEWFSKDESIRMDSRDLAYDFDSMSLDTPCLTYLEYSDYVPKEYIVVNLASLVEAKLNLCAGVFDAWDEECADINPMNLINGFKNVEILHVTFQTTDMFHAFREAIPVFEKLSQLSISLADICWVSALILIKKSPNLKTLIIDGSLHYGRREDEYLCDCVSEYSFLLSCPLEVLKINYYEGSIEELTQVKHFLEKSSCLELVEVDAWVSGDEEPQVMEDLLMLPRASSKCKIKVKFLRKRY